MRIAATKILPPEPEPSIETRHWLMLPSEARRWGQAMMHQQCWCWGQDIRRAEGNLLLRQGFARTRPPEGHKGSAAYEKRLDAKRAITLWGFGMCLRHSEHGSIFLSRFAFAPRLCARCEIGRSVWKPDQLADFHAPSTPEECRAALSLLGHALRWLGDYERSVLDEHGEHYRRDTLKEWSHAVLGPREVPNEWARLDAWCQRGARIWTRDGNGIRHEPAQGFEGFA